MKIKIGLFGLGRTGKVVAQSLREDTRFDLIFVVKDKVDKTDKIDCVVEPKERIYELVNEFKPDIVMDFTTPDAVMHNIEKLRNGTRFAQMLFIFQKEELEQRLDHIQFFEQVPLI